MESYPRLRIKWADNRANNAHVAFHLNENWPCMTADMGSGYTPRNLNTTPLRPATISITESLPGELSSTNYATISYEVKNTSTADAKDVDVTL